MGQLPFGRDGGARRVIIDRLSDVHDHDPDAFDDVIPGAEARVDQGSPDLEVTLAVPLSAATFAGLSERAAREGRNVADVVSDALRAAAA